MQGMVSVLYLKFQKLYFDFQIKKISFKVSFSCMYYTYCDIVMSNSCVPDSNPSEPV